MRRCSCNEDEEMNPILSKAWLSQGRGEVPWKQWSCARDSMRNKKLHALTSVPAPFSPFWDIIVSPSTTGVFMEKHLLIPQENTLLFVYLPQFIQVLTKPMHHSQAICLLIPGSYNLCSCNQLYSKKLKIILKIICFLWIFFLIKISSIPTTNEEINNQSVSLSWKKKQFPLSLQLLEK